MKTISIRSPTSLKVTLKQLRLGKGWNIDETFIREHQMATHFMAHPDFTEGVSARLINKPPTKPNWQPSKLADVSDEDVSKFFTQPDNVDRLALIDPLEGAKSQRGYVEYPYARFALPRETDIESVVRRVGSGGKNAIINELLGMWNNKLGAKEKIEEVLSRQTRPNPRGGLSWRDEATASL